jgi:pimeloyl-ACP methyl ester carboxylesterase
MSTPTPIRFLLVPGFWLGGWAWDDVTGRLRAAGHDVQALTLPGLDSPAPPRAAVTLDDHVNAVVDALAEQPDRGTILVGHSGAGPVIYAATDRAPHLVRRAVYVDSGPLPDGTALRPDLDPAATELPLPLWPELEAAGSSLAGLDDAALATFRRRAVPHPAGPAREPLRLADPRRYDVPVTVITSSIRSDDVRQMIANRHPFFAELADLDLTVVDLPTGHWPMWSLPDELARQLLATADGS